MVLLTGSVGSGKSTTIAIIINHINELIKSIYLPSRSPSNLPLKITIDVNQSDLGLMFFLTLLACAHLPCKARTSFTSAIRDYDTMYSAITAAETGVLVLSTLHTINAPQTVERIVNFFPPHQHHQIRMQVIHFERRYFPQACPPQRRHRPCPRVRGHAFDPNYRAPYQGEQGMGDTAFYRRRQDLRDAVFYAVPGQVGKGRQHHRRGGRDFADNKEEFYQALKGIKKMGNE